MYTYISLLRGINVSGKNRLLMPALVRLYQELGCTYVQSYIQSGNIVFNSESSTAVLEEAIINAIREQFDYTVPVFVREVSFFKNIVANNPFQLEKLDFLYITILKSSISEDLVSAMQLKQWEEDKFIVYNNVIYVYCPNGYGRTRLNNNFFETKAKTWATTRNWKTITELLKLANTFPYIRGS